MKRIEDLSLEKERKRDLKIKTIGNYVHDSVPIDNNEVRPFLLPQRPYVVLIILGQQRFTTGMGSRRGDGGEEGLPFTPRSPYEDRRLRS